MCLPLEIRYSLARSVRCSPFTSGVMISLRLPLVSLPNDTTPSISAMIA